ncbi:MAG: signal recognition particle-docking protein FtsY [Methanobrevibacter sp.]|nr:signal recognition particle-docking protein FtsY [Candidatus Methanovirga australis]
MFESLKKKFSNAANKLTKKVSDEAKKENNIEEEQREILDEINEPSSLDSKEISTTDKSLEKEVMKVDEEEFNIDEDGSDKLEENLEDENEAVIDDELSSEDKGKSEKKSFRKWLPSFGKKEKIEDISSTDEEFSTDEPKEKKNKLGFLSFIKEKTISEKDLEDILWELELGLLEGDVAIDVANIVVESVKEDLVGTKIGRSDEITDVTYAALKKAVSKIIDVDGKNMTKMLEEAKEKGEPLIAMFVGINGTGKTTTIAKLANYYLKKGYTPVVAASDTFRAGAIEQITHHTDNLEIKIIKHQKGSDPAAVAYDAIEHAKSKGKELVLIDTAGRMQTNTNLMDEMKKIKRITEPDIIIFVGDALTGNDAVEQASKFNDTIDIDGVILTKADADSKGGASLSISHVIQKPILFLGIGQGYDDIIEYDPDWMLEQLFS